MLSPGLVPYSEDGKGENGRAIMRGVVRFLALQAVLPGTELRESRH